MKDQHISAKGSKRDDILDVAERAILEKGVSATTIEELITEVGISKNGFFYHFQDKNQMIEAILDRNQTVDKEWFAGLFAQAGAAGADPLVQFLAFLDLLAEEMANLPDGHPGCLTTACCYQDRLLNAEVKEAAAGVLYQWRDIILDRLKRVAERHPPAPGVNLVELAEMLPALIDGAIIYARVVSDQTTIPRQVRLYKALIENTFGDHSSGQTA